MRWFADHGRYSAFITFILVVLIGIVNLPSVLQAIGPWSFILTVALLIAILAVIGATVNGNGFGVLIDGRNRVSLSKFQATLWTVIVLAALINAAAINLSFGAGAHALDITIPAELLVAMGISATSLLATPALLSLKATQQPAAPTVQATTRELGSEPQKLLITGKLLGNASPALASWADMFRGEEVGNGADADLSKVQQFAVTVVLVLVYGASVYASFSAAAKVTTLPTLSDQFVWLMGISHTSYLAYKAVPHTPDAKPTPQDDPRYQSVG